MTDRPRLSIIVVNWNGGELVLRVLEALTRSAAGLDAEVIVADNASRDGSADRISERFPDIRMLRLDRNLGFTGGNNRALELASGDALLLLNPDAILEADAVRTLLRYLNEHPDVGIVGPKLLLPDGRLDGACRRRFKTVGTYVYRILGLDRRFEKSPGFGDYNLTYLDPNLLTEVDSVSGACLLVRRKAMENAGGLFDDQFFMYCEDEDLCFRVKAAGWKIVYNPAAVVWHHKGGCSSRNPNGWERVRVRLYWHRALWLFHRKHLAQRYNVLTNGFVLLSIALLGAFSTLWTLLRPPRVPAFERAAESGTQY